MLARSGPARSLSYLGTSRWLPVSSKAGKGQTTARTESHSGNSSAPQCCTIARGHNCMCSGVIVAVLCCAAAEGEHGVVPSPPASLRTTAPDIAPLFPSEAMLVCATCKPESLRAQSRPRTDDGKLARFHVWRHERGVRDGQMIEFGPTRRSGQSRAVRRLGRARHDCIGPRGANCQRPIRPCACVFPHKTTSKT